MVCTVLLFHVRIIIDNWLQCNAILVNTVWFTISHSRWDIVHTRDDDRKSVEEGVVFTCQQEADLLVSWLPTVDVQEIIPSHWSQVVCRSNCVWWYFGRGIHRKVLSETTIIERNMVFIENTILGFSHIIRIDRFHSSCRWHSTKELK